MNGLYLTLAGLIIGLLGQALATGLFLERGWRPGSPHRVAWLALGCSTLLIGLQHGYTLAWLVRTLIFDLRGALLAALAGLLAGGAALILTRRS